MSKKKDWIEDLIALGIGALAIYFLVKILSPTGQEDRNNIRCPHCGNIIKKWAIECPICRRKIRSSPFEL